MFDQATKTVFDQAGNKDCIRSAWEQRLYLIRQGTKTVFDQAGNKDCI